ncbi:hypothetical protein F511_32207 [Dorcoceras hygrometricum]|uniref:Uncharacterized protein n=1 Tax=Dorcoceras hygrometricum TaxID=472368 RepID=A0A2Z7DJL4_9LAMI|nr:hypothetical protein F511_32207 [Dorcoceras hygrometricum]
MLLSRSADTDLCFSVFLLRTAKRQRFDKLERRRGVHYFSSAEEDFSRLFVEEVQQMRSGSVARSRERVPRVGQHVELTSGVARLVERSVSSASVAILRRDLFRCATSFGLVATSSF